MRKGESEQIIFNAVREYVDPDPHFGLKAAPLQDILHVFLTVKELTECYYLFMTLDLKSVAMTEIKLSQDVHATSHLHVVSVRFWTVIGKKLAGKL